MSDERNKAVAVVREPESATASLVAQGITLVRAENESMSAIGRLHPRMEREVLQDALAELELVPEQAKEAFYSIPFKDRKGGNKTTYVQGLSIDGATSLARRWGNCAVGGRIINEDETGVDVEGVFFDYQTNFRMAKPHRASKIAKVENRWISLDAQRLLMAVQSSVSKAQRNAIEAGLPPYLTKAYFEKARLLVAGNPEEKADPKKIDAVIKAFERFRVTQAMLEESVGQPRDNWYGDDVANLRGLYKALQDGGTTILEIWPPKDATPQAAPGAVSVESLGGAKVTGKDDAKDATVPVVTEPGGMAAPQVSTLVSDKQPEGAVVSAEEVAAGAAVLTDSKKGKGKKDAANVVAQLDETLAALGGGTE